VFPEGTSQVTFVVHETPPVQAGICSTVVVFVRRLQAACTSDAEQLAAVTVVPEANVAVTVEVPEIENEHEPVPLQFPLQPVNVDPEFGVSEHVTVVPAASVVVPVAQFATLLIVPLPDPAVLTVRL